MLRTHVTARRRAAVAFVMIATLTVGVLQASAANAAGQGYQRKMLDIVNRTRARHDLRLLKLNRELSRDSLVHTRKMVRNDRIYDPPNLAEILADYEWDDVGADVVGCGHTLKELHDILMTEAFHRSIFLHPDLRRVGIGVMKVDERNRCGRGSLWATEIFYG
ncbi:MAG: CAP domain-containing protein [Actinomycetota bacterium]